MTEEAQPSVEPEVAASEPTLDDVISEFNIEPTVEAQQPAEVPVEQQFTPQTEIDPYDASSIQNFVNNGLSQQQQTLEQLKSQVTAMQQKEQNAQTEADIKQAVGVLTTKVEGLGANMAEAFLEMKARTDSNFSTIWNNRHTNPQAFEKAMDVISTQAKSEFSLKQDGQLVENQRAMQQSIQSNTNQAAPAANSWEEKLEAAETLAERDQLRREMMGKG